MCLTGAGTNPNLLTPYVTDALLNWPLFAAPSTAGSGPTDLVRRDALDTRSNFFVWLKDQTREAFAPGDVANFEDLIHITELMGGILPLPPDDSTASFARFYGTGLLEPTSAGQLISKKGLDFVAARAATFVLRTVYERTRSVAFSDARKLLEALIASGFLLRHFSLNYDTLVLPSAKFWTGYADGTGAQGFTFTGTAPHREHLNIHMHGSIHFAISAAALTDACDIVRFDDPAIACNDWDLSSSGHNAMDRHEAPRVPLIVGRRKAEKSLIEPFSSYLHYFRETAFSTPTWLILGYGGGDFHINRILQSAAEHWKDRLRVFVCNYLPANEMDYGTGEYTVASGYPAYKRVEPREAGILRAFYWDMREFREAFRPNPKLIRNATNAITGRLRLTVDGAFYDHRGDIVEHLRSA
jgi:hypothetical protein